jgi:hypothetical protein
MFFYLYIDGHSNFMQFHYRLIVHQRLSISLSFDSPSKTVNLEPLQVFDGLSNDNEIT